MIGKLLGHSQVQTTARYAHLANDPIKSAAERISGTANGNGKERSEVLSAIPPDDQSVDDLVKEITPELRSIVKALARHVARENFNSQRTRRASGTDGEDETL